MKSVKSFFSVILIVFYLFFPGSGLALANHYFHERGLPVIDCSCCTETEKNSADHPLPGSGDRNDFLEHACSCGCHLPSRVHNPIFPNALTALLPGDAQKFYPDIYLPIFVPPQNLI
ncbi:MAG: hypothetical protein EG828_03295 [Deltaproteobacteria bacterium]|nr:hypothetical protein [Deltaproteobacteria bacterium]